MQKLIAQYAMRGTMILALVGCAPRVALSPSPQPTQQPSLSSEGAPPPWLARLNQIRTANGLEKIEESKTLDDADLKHATYLVKASVPEKLSAKMHDEDASSPYFSELGRAAGKTGNVLWGDLTENSDAQIIDSWLYAPFHALALIDPELREAGFARACDGKSCAAVLSFGRGASWNAETGEFSDLPGQAHHRFKQVSAFADDATNRQTFARPILFPPDGGEIVNTRFEGNEWPNPLTACAGYRVPTGPVLIASFGRDFSPKISDYSFSVDGAPVEACAITSDSYANKDASTLHSGQGGLKHFAAVFIVPRQPLREGVTCVASISTDAGNAKWSFHVISDLKNSALFPPIKKRP